MREIPAARQIPGEPRRRWFCDEFFDLIVWFAEDDTILGFQLCYDRSGHPRALTWTSGRGFSHSGIDDGESGGIAPKSTPVLVPDGSFDAAPVTLRFQQASSNLPAAIRTTVLARLAELTPRQATPAPGHCSG